MRVSCWNCRQLGAQLFASSSSVNIDPLTSGRSVDGTPWEYSGSRGELRASV